MNNGLHKEIDQAKQLYDVGDYKAAREIARKLEGDKGLSEEDRQRLSRILEATRSDPVVIMALIFTLSVILFIVLKYTF